MSAYNFSSEMVMSHLLVGLIRFQLYWLDQILHGSQKAQPAHIEIQ